MTLFTTLGLLAGYKACCGQRIAWGWCMVFGMALSLGTLIKGPVAVVLCVPPLLAVRWLSPERARMCWRHGLLLASIMLVLIAPWFVAVSQTDQQYAQHFFWKHHVVRFLNAFHHVQPWWFYLPVVLVAMFPVSLLFPALVRYLFQRRSIHQARASQELGFLVVASTWIVFFFSLSSCKLPTYVLPAFPLLCLLMGSLLDNVLFAPGSWGALARSTEWIPRRATLNAATIAIGVTLVDLFLLEDGLFDWRTDVLVLVSASLLFVLYWRVSPRPTRAAWAFSAALASAVMLFVCYDFVPELSRVRSLHAEVAELHAETSHAPVVYFDRQSYAATFHVQSSSVQRFDSDELAEVGEFLQRHPEVILVTRPDGAEEIRQRFGTLVELLPHGTRGQLFVSHPRISAASNAKTRGSAKAR